MQIQKKCFNRLLLVALVLLMMSATVTFFVLANTSHVAAADQAFKDIPLDHPAYQLCHQLIQIGAVRLRPGMTMAPFEKMSANDWNYALMRIGEHLDRAIPESAKFGANDEVVSSAIVSRLQSLAPDKCKLLRFPAQDNTRMAVYYMIERCFFAYNY